MKRELNILFLFLPIFCFSINVQGQQLDAIEIQIDQMPEDTTKVNSLIELGEHYCSRVNKKALLHLQEALFLANKLNYKKGSAYSYLWLGRVYYYMDEYKLAKTNLNKSRQLLVELNDYKGLAFNHLACGSISDLKGNYIIALQEYHEAVKYGMLAKSEKYKSSGLYSIGALHLDRNEVEEGLAYLMESLEIKKAMKDTAWIANTYNLMARAYEQKDLPDSAIVYYTMGLELREMLGDIRAIANSKYAMGIFFISKNEYPKAIEYLKSSREIYIQLEEQTGLCITNTHLALAFNYSGKKQEANQLIHAALEDAQIFKNPTLIADAYKAMAEMEAYNGNHQKAYELTLKLKVLSDSMALVNKEDVIQDLEARYKLQSKNSHIVLLESQANNQRKNNLILSISMGALALIVLLIAFLYRLKTLAHTRQKKMFEQEKTIREQEEKIKDKEMLLLQEDLESQNRNLATKALEMLRVNETIGAVISKMESLCNMNSENAVIRGQVREIVRELEKQTNANTWKEFDKIFKNIHTEFYKNLLKTCPSLTASEIKIAALLKLNLSTKEIAAITYKSEDGIKSTRYRLRKKLNLTGEDKLIPFLMKL